VTQGEAILHPFTRVTQVNIFLGLSRDWFRLKMSHIKTGVANSNWSVGQICKIVKKYILGHFMTKLERKNHQKIETLLNFGSKNEPQKNDSESQIGKFKLFCVIF
jgi:hypothetical protein